MSEIEFKTFSGKVIDIWVPNCVTERSHGSNTRLEQFKNQHMVFFFVVFSPIWFSQLQFSSQVGSLQLHFLLCLFMKNKIAHFSWRCENMLRQLTMDLRNKR